MWRRLRSKHDGTAPTDSPANSPGPACPNISDFQGSERRQSVDTVEKFRESRPVAEPMRRPSEKSDISDIQGQLFPVSPLHQRQRSQDRREDPLGLTVLHTPEIEPRSVDIVFIHGLGGTSLRSWCKNRAIEYFWPQRWLPGELDLSSARILTFGYHAHFAAKKQQVMLTIQDFANDLLFRMKYGEEGHERMGEVPIVIVAHSMGGLVFKKAFIYGHLNDEYRKIVSCIKAVLFLATPHRGTDLADILSKILSSSIFGHSPKEYVKELARSSPTIDEINESFRHHADKLQIFSFYETLGTSVGPVNMMILEKFSSVLGYQHETSQPLVANHHDVCKFASPDDPNYQSIRGALRSVVNSLRISEANDNKDLDIVHRWLGVVGAPEDDRALFRSIWKTGTCEDIINKPEFEAWVQADEPQVLWVHSPPGNGKSVQCSFLIEYLKERQARCVYWFFKYGDAQKRSLSNMLRSVAAQIAAEDPVFCQSLANLSRSGAQIHKADAATVWRMVFATRLSTIDSMGLYWIVDGLDESESSKTFIELVSRLGSISSSIRILVSSRPLSSIIQAIQRARKKIPVAELALSDNLKDIRLVAVDEMEYFPKDDEFKEDTINEITARSQGNFLWASLVLKQVVRCYRQEDVKRVLRATPDGMDKLYLRMTDAISKIPFEQDKTLARILLSWAMYSIRPIRIQELVEAYPSELGTVMDLKFTVGQVCGQFVVINPNNQIVLVHHTAREYLRGSEQLTFSLGALEVNEELFIRCLSAFCDTSLRKKLRQRRIPNFLSYASVSWHTHLNQSLAESDRVLEMLVKFFNDPGAFPLPWIHYLALNQHLSVLIAVSSSLTSFVRRRRKADAIKPPTLTRLPELSMLETWALDILKMTAKFGSYLAGDPTTIYKHIPPMSPENSMLFQKFAKKATSAISVSSFGNLDWDDCLARVSSGSEPALHVAVSVEYLAVANDSPNGQVQLWSNVIFQDEVSFHPGEPICKIAFSDSGSMLACYCLDHTYVWKVKDGSTVAQVESPRRERAEEMRFGSTEAYIVVATDLRRVYRLNLDTTSPSWFPFDSSLLEESFLPEGSFINSPSSLAFNPDCTQLAVAYRGFPLAIWTLDPPDRIALCRRKPKHGYSVGSGWSGVNRVVWHPLLDQVLGIFRDGNIFKWGPLDDVHEEVEQELDATPSEIQCSRNGCVFATSDVKGSIKVYDYSQMVLIYKLTSDDIIRAIAFSPDSRRLYDLRGSYANVWEPNCLIRLVDTSADTVDDTESVTSTEREMKGSLMLDSDDVRSTAASFSTSEAHADSKPSITGIATCSGNARVVAYAKDDGTIELYDLERECRHVVARSMFGMGVLELALSRNGQFVAYAMIDRRVTVKNINLSARPGKLLSKQSFSNVAESSGIIKQFLFDTESQKLLVYGASTLQVLDVRNGTVIAERSIESSEASARWKLHPKDSTILLGLTPDGFQALSWDTLEIKFFATLDLRARLVGLPPETPLHIELLVDAYHPNMQFAVSSVEESNNTLFNLHLLDISPLHQNPPSDGSQTIEIPSVIADNIGQPISILPNGCLVFLDRDLWVCTVRLRATATGGVDRTIARHFFVPRDWLNSAGLVLCKVLSDGTFLCPSKGEIAVIRSDDMVSGW